MWTTNNKTRTIISKLFKDTTTIVPVGSGSYMIGILRPSRTTIRSGVSDIILLHLRNFYFYKLKYVIVHYVGAHNSTVFLEKVKKDVESSAEAHSSSISIWLKGRIQNDTLSRIRILDRKDLFRIHTTPKVR